MRARRFFLLSSALSLHPAHLFLPPQPFPSPRVPSSPLPFLPLSHHLSPDLFWHVERAKPSTSTLCGCNVTFAWVPDYEDWTEGPDVVYSLPGPIQKWIFGRGGLGETIVTHLNMSFNAAIGTVLNPVAMTSGLLDAIEVLCEGWSWRDHKCTFFRSRYIQSVAAGACTHTHAAY